MNRCRKKNTPKGFTMPELIVTMFVLSLFSLALMGMLVLGMRFFRRADDYITAQLMCRNTMEIIVNEVRQGVAFEHPVAGYGRIQSGGSPPPATAFLEPNNCEHPKKIYPNQIDPVTGLPAEFHHSNKIIVTLPVSKQLYDQYVSHPGGNLFQDFWRPFDADFQDKIEDPRIYYHTEYYVSEDGKILWRTVRTFNENGSQYRQMNTPVAQVDRGKIELDVYYKGNRYVTIDLKVVTDIQLGTDPQTGLPRYKEYVMTQDISLNTYE